MNFSKFAFWVSEIMLCLTSIILKLNWLLQRAIDKS